MDENKKKINICYNYIIVFCLFFIFYPNVSLLNHIPLLPFLLIKTICSIIFFIIFIKNTIKYKQIDFFVLIIIAFYVYATIITKLNNGDMLTAIFENLIFGTGLVLFVKIYINKNRNLFINVAVIYFLIYHIINFSYIFINISNSSTGWFFDNRNNAFRYLMPLIYFFTIYIREKNKNSIEDFDNEKTFLQNRNENIENKSKKSFYKIFSILIFASIIFISIYSKALTTLICFLILIPYIIFFLDKDIKFFNIYIYLGIVLIIFILFTLPPINKMVMSPICILFGKSESANGRFLIYDKIIESISKGNIIFGNGIPKLYEYLEGDNFGVGKVVLAHSLYLDVFYKFGIVGSLLFLVIIIVMIQSINKCTNIFYKNLVSIFMFIILLWSIADEIYIYRLLFYFAFCYYILLCEEKKYEVSI